MQCERDTKASAGESEVGDTPLLNGVRSLLKRVGGSAGGLVEDVSKFLLSAAELILSPLALFTAATTFIAAGLALGLQIFFPLAAMLSSLPGAPNPVLMAAILLVFAIRAACLPVSVRASRNAVRLQALAPQIRRLQKTHAGDRDKLAQEQMNLYRRTGANPLSSCIPVILLVTLLSGLWTLLKGLTVRSATGTFEPRFTSRDSGLYHYLNSAPELTNWRMDLTLTLPQVGTCARVTPYLGSLALLTGLQCLQARDPWRLGHRELALALTVTSVAVVAMLPVFFIILKIADVAAILMQTYYLQRVKRHEFKRLRSDPNFRQSMAELGTEFFPADGPQPSKPAGEMPGSGPGPHDWNPRR